MTAVNTTTVNTAAVTSAAVTTATVTTAADTTITHNYDRLITAADNNAAVNSTAVTTADVLALPTRTRLAHEADLRELNFGRWDGMHASAISISDPDLSRAYWTTPGDVVAPDGESWNQAASRINAAVDRINARHPDTHIIAVAHFGTILTQIQRALGVDAHAAMAYKIDNLSTTEIHISDGSWSVLRINHTP
ncbi:MAG: histidine phosphatase family protein [Sulfitobacter sp.]|nr:MAG: histidine phosphatase family protein [Sulfitobacter sp.]